MVSAEVGGWEREMVSAERLQNVSVSSNRRVWVAAQAAGTGFLFVALISLVLHPASEGRTLSRREMLADPSGGYRHYLAAAMAHAPATAQSQPSTLQKSAMVHLLATKKISQLNIRELTDIEHKLKSTIKKLEPAARKIALQTVDEGAAAQATHLLWADVPLGSQPAPAPAPQNKIVIALPYAKYQTFKKLDVAPSAEAAPTEAAVPAALIGGAAEPAAVLPTAVEKKIKKTATAGPGAPLPSAAADAAGAGEEVVVGCSGEPGGCVGTRTAVRVFVPLGLFAILGMLLMWSYYKFQEYERKGDKQAAPVPRTLQFAPSRRIYDTFGAAIPPPPSTLGLQQSNTTVSKPSDVPKTAVSKPSDVPAVTTGAYTWTPSLRQPPQRSQPQRSQPDEGSHTLAYTGYNIESVRSRGAV